jgi:hypothetical protein
VSETGRFDPYAVFEVLGRERVSYVVAGGLARVVHGSGETTRNVDVVPLLREDNLRRLAHALEGLGATGRDGNRLDATELAAPGRFAARTGVGEIGVVAYPWGTRGYEDLRIRAYRENLGRGIRPPVASLVDCVRMLEASERELDGGRLERLRRLMELERQLIPQRRLGIER